MRLGREKAGKLEGIKAGRPGSLKAWRVQGVQVSIEAYQRQTILNIRSIGHPV